MKCKQTQILLADYSAQRLPPSDAEGVRHHIAECPACAHLLQEEALLAGGLEQVPFVEPSGSMKMWQAVAVGLDSSQPLPQRPWWALQLRPAPSMAAFVTAAAAVAGLYLYGSQPVMPPVTQVAHVSDMPRILTMTKEVNPVVDDPLADHTDVLFAAVNRMTQNKTSPSVQ